MIHQQDSQELSTLIARLSDGLLTQEEASRLNVLLKKDPISLEIYLEQVLIDGLLHMQLGSSVAEGSFHPKVERRKRPVRSRLIENLQLLTCRKCLAPLCVALIAFVAACTSWLLVMPTTKGPRRISLKVANPGFESSAKDPLIDSSVGQWYGDATEVVETHAGIRAIEGKRMLRFVGSKFEPHYACDIFHLIDMGHVASEISSNKAAVQASAYFNALQGVASESTSFGITLYAYAGIPEHNEKIFPLRGTQPLAFFGRQQSADADVKTWQRVEARLPIPVETTYLLVHISAINQNTSSGEFSAEISGHVLDAVEVYLEVGEAQAHGIRAAVDGQRYRNYQLAQSKDRY